ncbi:Rho-type GTPase-activating protein [Drechslerella dactyloides]|uniref:Rho-type GTPase-activating protein n=1 Tax=Drechslerella dactyloides TaxID=74499 RepID=A0AAD6NIX7_DREDA|nr:Rho-type GTPase-activating protein [Drechslerella dactyloides]
MDRERSRSRPPTNSSATPSSSNVPFPDYYLPAGLEEQRATPPPPPPISKAGRQKQEERSQPKPSSHILQKARKKEGSIPKLTLRKPEERDAGASEAQSASTTTSSSSGFKFGRGRSKTTKGSPTSQDSQTPKGTPSTSDPTSPSMSSRRPSEPPSSSGSGQRSSSSDGRISSKLKASKAAIQHEKHKWSIKGASVWGKLTSKNPKSAVFAPAGFGSFPQKPVIDVVGMPLTEATIKTRTAKELVPGVDAAAYWLPALAYRLITYLNVYGPKEQGIYRVPGSTMAVDKLRDDFAHRHDVDLFQAPPDDVNTASSLLKGFIRALPEPILPAKFQEELFEKVRDYTNANRPPQVFKDMLSSLPPQNYYLLQLLTNHLSNVRLAEDVTRMGLSNLAMIFCSTMKMDRYIFHWLVGSWSDCWGGCWAEEGITNGVRVSTDTRSGSGSIDTRSGSIDTRSGSIDTRSGGIAGRTGSVATRSGSIATRNGSNAAPLSLRQKEELAGLGIRTNGRSVGGSISGQSVGGQSKDGWRSSQDVPIPHPSLPTPREPTLREPSPSTAAGKTSRKRGSGVDDSLDSPSYESERGRKRASREMDWPNAPAAATSKHHRRLSSTESGASLGSTIGQAAFTSGSTIRQVPPEPTTPRIGENEPLTPRINELIGSFRSKARERRSVDMSQLAALAQQASLHSPGLPPPPPLPADASKMRQAPMPPTVSTRNLETPGKRSRNASHDVAAGSPKPSGVRTRSAERTPISREVELLPPMPPMSPLMATGPNYNGF